MEEKDDREGTGHNIDREDLSIVDAIKAICAHNARAQIDSEEKLLLFLKSWWSKTYNKPLKDPILQTYTIDELLYEFYDRIERTTAAEEANQSDNEKIENDKEQADLDWAAKEELKELEAAKIAESDPTTDPNNLKWMEEQIKKDKIIHGETFGEDIDDSF